LREYLLIGLKHARLGLRQPVTGYRNEVAGLDKSSKLQVIFKM